MLLGTGDVHRDFILRGQFKDEVKQLWIQCLISFHTACVNSYSVLGCSDPGYYFFYIFAFVDQFVPAHCLCSKSIT